MSRERYRIGDLEVDVGAARVERRGVPLRLTGLTFDLLVALARRAPVVVDHDTLTREVWNQTVVSDETIMQRVALLRRASSGAPGWGWGPRARPRRPWSAEWSAAWTTSRSSRWSTPG